MKLTDWFEADSSFVQRKINNIKAERERVNNEYKKKIIQLRDKSQIISWRKRACVVWLFLYMTTA